MEDPEDLNKKASGTGSEVFVWKRGVPCGPIRRGPGKICVGRIRCMLQRVQTMPTRKVPCDICGGEKRPDLGARANETYLNRLVLPDEKVLSVLCDKKITFAGLS